MDQSAILKAMSEPEFYAEAPSKVKVVETHISTLFLTDDFVYKVKKPVDFGFLDFTSLWARRFFCEQELLLNQRLSNNVYLAVLPIHETGQTFSFEAQGPVVEYAVKMRRLPEARMMEALFRNGEIDGETIRKVALLLIGFHSRTETGPEISIYGTPSRITKNTEENFHQTEPFVGTTLSQEQYDRITEYTRSFISQHQSLLQKRIRENRIRDCHGDIRMEHICIEDPIVIFDCIEFNRRFRYSDVAADLAFLAMDLDFHNAPEHSRRLLQAYVEYTRDIDLLRLIRFYKCYRAYVRGKVESFKGNDQSLGPEERDLSLRLARRYFRLSETYSRWKPFLVITSGLTGTGKTRLAQSLALNLDASLFQSDRVRKQIAQIALTEHRYDTFGEGIYSDEVSAKTYERLRSKAQAELEKGKPVILDATHLKHIERDKAQDLAEEMEAPFFVIEVVCAEEKVKKRLLQRMLDPGQPSDGRWEIYIAQKGIQDPIQGIPSDHHLVVNTCQEKDMILEVEKAILFATET